MTPARAGGRFKPGLRVTRLDRIHESDDNPRSIDDARWEDLGRSLAADPGMLRARPIVADLEGEIVCGHMRHRRLVHDGVREAPVFFEDFSGRDGTKRKREWKLRDNTEYGDWIPDELAALVSQHAEEGGQLELLGPPVDELLALLPSTDDDGDVEPPIPPTPKRPTTRRGDLIALGDHRLLCGDSTSPDDVARLTAGVDVDFVFTSPPYNVEVQYDDHDDATKDWPAYRAFLAAVLEAWMAHLGDGRAIGWNIGVSQRVFPHHQAIMLAELGLTFQRQMIWRKMGVPLPKWHLTRKNPQARRFTPNPTHEVIYIASKGPLQTGDAVEVDELAANDVFEIHQSQSTRDVGEGGTRTGSGQSINLETRAYKAHPAVFPVRLATMFVNHFAAPGEVVADPFAGAGTVALAAHRLGRRALLMEVSPAYCDVAIARWEQMTGETAVRPRRRTARR